MRTWLDVGRPPEELLLSIGGLVGRLSLAAAPSPFVQQLRQRYQAFSLPPSQSVAHDFAVELQFRSARPPADRTHPAAARPLVVTAGPTDLALDRWDFGARLRRRGAVSRLFSGVGSCELNPFAFDSLLRVLWSVFLPRAGGALFHACGLRHQDTGLLAPGRSGAGKTTLARKLPDPDDVLSDEVVAVHPDGPGRWRISGTPFWGDFARGGVSLRSLPLTGVAFLEQTDQAGVRPVSTAQAVQRALSCLICFEAHPQAVARNLEIVAALCGQVPTIICGSRVETSAAELLGLLRPFLLRPSAERQAPRSPREMISELRWHLHRHAGYAFRPRGGSMHPGLRSGDSLFVTRVGREGVRTGEVLLYWRPGRTPDDDRLTCHRLVARLPGRRGARLYTKGDAIPRIERFENGRDAEILGQVQASCRPGEAVRLSGRTRGLAMLLGSLASLPLLRMLRPPA